MLYFLQNFCVKQKKKKNYRQSYISVILIPGVCVVKRCSDFVDTHQL